MAEGEHRTPVAERQVAPPRSAGATSSVVAQRRRPRWFGHPWVRAFHRDAGFLVVGLTVIYALSGLAVNHIADWDPNFQNYAHKHQLGRVLHGDDATMARTVLQRLGISNKPSDVFHDGDLLDITFDDRTLHVTVSTGQVLEQGQKPRLLLRTANYLHLNRGKPAWKYIADGYAALLLLLAFSGLFMLPGKKGLLGRGLVLTAIGIAIPVLYVTLT